MSLQDDVASFRRRVAAQDEMQDMKQQIADAAVRVPLTVVYGEMMTTSTGFLPLPQRLLRVIPTDGDGSACTCTLDELWGIWRGHDPAQVIEEYEQFPTTIPSGRTRVRACLRFCKCDNGVVSEALNGTISSAATAALASIGANGCYAVNYFGTKNIGGGGSRHVPRDFQGSTVDFIIYKLLCDD